MKRFFSHPLFLSFLAAAILYVIFAYVMHPPLPHSLLVQYMIFCVIGILMVATFDDRTARRMGDPIRALMGDPRLMIPRAVALIAVVVGAGWMSYGWVKPDLGAPIELRTVHPAPPSNLRVYGKSYDLLKLQNPLTADAPKGSEAREEIVKEGSALYYKNCIYCHGDLLDGKGHFASVFNPLPANFQDVGTIAQLQESYLFWRITTGAPGLPREGSPWASAMPVWHEMLKEDEVWKIITFLYDYTGHVPRSWEKEGAGAEAKEQKNQTADKETTPERIRAIYDKRCAHCHGDEGDGMGPAAEFMYPLPRDFTLGTFKYKSTHADNEFPTDDDLRRTINEGLAGTAMPGWKTILSKKEIDGLIGLIKEFGGWDTLELELKAIDEGKQVPSSEESIARGRDFFVKACVQCHGEKGRGNVTSGKILKDDWRHRIWPRNLTQPSSWRASNDVRLVFQRISTGIRSTPMPEHTTTMSVESRWDVANYVMTLRNTAVQPDPANTVIRAVRMEGSLPSDPDDPVWEQAGASTFRLSPNIIKEPRLFFSLNEYVTARALFNGEEISIRVDVDDRTYSVPGDPEEIKYRQEGVEPTRDAVAIQLPLVIPTTSEKPWFRHGDPKHSVNMWYWSAPSVEPQAPPITMMLDANGPDAAPHPRKESGPLQAKGAWENGQWRIVMKRALKTGVESDLQFEEGQYIPVAFANWDGVAGEKGGRHSFTSWYWLLLEPEENTAMLYGVPLGAGLLAGLLFVYFARRQRARFDGQKTDN